MYNNSRPRLGMHSSGNWPRYEGRCGYHPFRGAGYPNYSDASNTYNNRGYNSGYPNVNYPHLPYTTNNYVSTHDMGQRQWVDHTYAATQQQYPGGSDSTQVFTAAPQMNPPPPGTYLEPKYHDESLATVPYTGTGSDHSIASGHATVAKVDDYNGETAVQIEKSKYSNEIAEINKKHEEQMQNVLKINQTLTTEKDALSSQLASIKQEKEEQTQSYKKECSLWREKAKHAIRNLTSTEAELENALVLIGSLQNGNAIMKTELENNLQAITKLKENEKKRELENESLAQTVNQQKQTIQNLTNDLEKAKAKHENKMIEFSKLDYDFGEISTNYENTTKELNKLTDENHVMKKELINKNQQISQQQTKLQELETMKVERDKEIKELRESYGKLKDEKAKVESFNSQLEQKVKDLNESIEKNDKEKKSLQLKMQKQTVQISHLKAEVEDLKNGKDEFATELGNERDLNYTMVGEFMEIFTRPNNLNRLRRERMNSSSSVPVAEQSSECSATVASDENPELSPCDIQPVPEDCCTGNTIEEKKGNPETELDQGRKRKLSTRGPWNGEELKKVGKSSKNSEEDAGPKEKQAKGSGSRSPKKVTDPTTEQVSNGKKLSPSDINHAASSMSAHFSSGNEKIDGTQRTE